MPAGASLQENIKATLRSIPVVRDVFTQYYGFEREGAAFRGVFDSFEAARAATPSRGKIGHGHFVAHAEMRRKSYSVATTGRELADFNPADYAAALWMARATRAARRVADIGGNFGNAYFSFSEKIPFPDGLGWIVCEIPEVVAASRNIPEVAAAAALSFTAERKELDGADVLFSAGSLQYLPEELDAIVEAMRPLPRWVITQRVPLTQGPSFITLQNITYGYSPYAVRSEAAFEAGMMRLGYRVADRWRTPRTLRIPFHPGRTLHWFTGHAFVID